MKKKVWTIPVRRHVDLKIEFFNPVTKQEATELVASGDDELYELIGEDVLLEELIDELE